jgi:TatD DNase family protein
MPAVDAHCHLQEERFDADRETVIAQSLEKLAWIVIVGDTVENSRSAAALSRDRVFATAGLHPHHAKDFDEAASAAIRELAAHPAVRAVGETGLDYHYDFSPRPQQRRAFEAQLRLAAELKLPVVIHNRESDADCLEILRPHAPDLAGIVIHCFGSDAAFAEKCLDLGAYISFAGNVTFPKAAPLREAAAAVPLSRIMAETDAPYLAPQPCRGKRCEPVFVEYTIQRLAEIKGVSFEAMCAATARNAAAFYRLDER